MDSKQLNNENLNNVSGGNLTDSNKTFVNSSAMNDAKTSCKSSNYTYGSDSNAAESDSVLAGEIPGSCKDNFAPVGSVLDSDSSSDKALGMSKAWDGVMYSCKCGFTGIIFE